MVNIVSLCAHIHTRVLNGPVLLPWSFCTGPAAKHPGWERDTFACEVRGGWPFTFYTRVRSSVDDWERKLESCRLGNEYCLRTVWVHVPLKPFVSVHPSLQKIDLCIFLARPSSGPWKTRKRQEPWDLGWRHGEGQPGSLAHLFRVGQLWAVSQAVRCFGNLSGE